MFPVGFLTLSLSTSSLLLLFVAFILCLYMGEPQNLLLSSIHSFLHLTFSAGNCIQNCRFNPVQMIMRTKNVVHWRRECKPLQYSCLENPMNSMKRQNDRLPKEELPRSLGAQSATGDQWRNNSRKNEGMESTKNNTQLWI